jgi:hypothetical protein
LNLVRRQVGDGEEMLWFCCQFSHTLSILHEGVIFKKTGWFLGSGESVLWRKPLYPTFSHAGEKELTVVVLSPKRERVGRVGLKED